MNTKGTATTRLRAIEYGLFAIGATLAVWAFVVWLQAWHFERLPVPESAGAVADRALRRQVPRNEQKSSPAPPAIGAWVARFDAPSVRLSTTVLEGSDDGTLRGAAGHIEDTAFPGQAGNIGIAGHRDTIFRPIRNLHVGDPLVLTTTDRVFHYRISNTMVVNPNDVYVLDPTERPTLTLVTCYPFTFVGHAPRRFIVRAELVGDEARSRQRSGGSGGSSPTTISPRPR
jgi:LPXTG-site transpeptidase (sortase) family protein